MNLCTELQQFGVRRKGCCVRSKFYGLGQVVDGGEEPLVRFLDGQEIQVPADNLHFVPTEGFEAEIANRTLWNRFLTLRVCGRGGLDGCESLWVRDDEGIWTSPERQRQAPTNWSGPIEHFVPDDIGQDVRVLGPNDLPDDRDVIECTVTRVLHDEGGQAS